MNLPIANKLQRIFFPIPGNNENNLEQGMCGIKTVAGNSEIWYRPIADGATPIPDPLRIAVWTQDVEFKSLLTGPVLASGDKLILLDSTQAFGMVLQDVAGEAQMLFTADIMGFADANLTLPVVLSAPGTTELNTTAKELIDSINETLAGSTDAEFFQSLAIEAPALTRDKYGPQVAVDPFMTAATPAAYTAVSSAVLSTETNDEGGQATRATYNGVSAYGLSQNIHDGDNFQSLARVRCDTSRTVRIRNGSGASVSKTVGTNWVCFLVSGGSSTALLVEVLGSAGYVEVDWLLSNKIRPAVPVTGPRYEQVHLRNDLLQSEDLDTTWTHSNIEDIIKDSLLSPVIDRATGLQVPYEGVAGSAADTSHSVRQDVAATAEPWVLSFWTKAGTIDWLRVLFTGGANPAIYLNPANLAEGGAVGTLETSFIKSGDDIFCRVQTTLTAITYNVRIYGALADGDDDYAGGVTVPDFWVQGMQMRPGTLQDNPPYVKTTVAPETGDVFWLMDETVQEYRKRLGLLERYINDQPGNIHETPNEVDHYVSPNTDTPSGSNTRRKYYSGLTGAATVTLETAPGWTNFWGSFGYVKDNAASVGVVPMNSWVSSVSGTRISIEGTDLVLRVGTGLDGASDSFKAWVDFEA